jgi:hypothetical protein
MRPVPAPVGGLGRRGHAVVHTRRGGVGAGGRAIDCTSFVARVPTIRAGMCVDQLSDLTGPRLCAPSYLLPSMQGEVHR